MKQRDLEIRHLAGATEKFYVATALFEKTVAVWNLETDQLVGVFDTILDFGGKRLILSKDGLLCITGAYHYGVTAYRTDTGQVAWERNDLKKPQRLYASPNQNHIYCCFEDKPCHVLDLRDGQTIRVHHGVRKVLESPYESRVFLYKHRSEICDLEKRISTKLVSLELGVVCAAFSPGQLIISGNYVDCFDVQAGKKLWRYEPPRGSHALEVDYLPTAEAFFIVQWSYQKGGSKTLVRLDRKDGKSEIVLDLGEPAEALFCMQGHWLVLSDGRVIEVASGQQKKVQDFLAILQKHKIV